MLRVSSPLGFGVGVFGCGLFAVLPPFGGTGMANARSVRLARTIAGECVSLMAGPWVARDVY